MEEHPTAKQLTAFVEGRLERQQVQLVVAHLLRGCPECGKSASRVLARGRSLPESAYDTVFERTSLAVPKLPRQAAAAPRRKRAPLRLAIAAPAG